MPYFAQPTGVTCQSTVLKMIATYLEQNVVYQSTGAADRAIQDIWKDINEGPNRPVAVGTWEQIDHPLGLKPVNTFESNGRGSVKVANVLVTYKYRLTGNNLVIEPDAELQGALKGFNATEHYTVAFHGNEMTLTSLDNRPFFPREQRFRRLK